jgi:peptide-methionine (S)-S-oxide reductase
MRPFVAPRRSRVGALAAVTLVLAAAAILFASRRTEAATPTHVPHALHASAERRTAVFAGGCFWGIEAVFEHVRGVTDAVSGFAGGGVKNPGYEEVSTGATGHAESVKVTYDPALVSYHDLLRVFFTVAHDPTQLNRQGPDVGTQYRSAIFYADESQKREAVAFIDSLTKARAFRAPIVTQVVPLSGFYPAEAYHQDFAERNPTYPYIVINDRPKVEALKHELPSLWQERLAAARVATRR